MNNQVFDISRFNNYLVRQGTLYINQMMLAAGAMFGIILVATGLVAYFSSPSLYAGNPIENGPVEALWAFYIAVYFMAGYVLTSASFSELNSPHSGYAFLTLPVSNLEKLSGVWLITSLVYTLFYFVAVSIIFLACGILFSRPDFSVAVFTSPTIIQFIGTYLVTQTVFLLGASTFTKFNLIKTLLVLIVLIIVISAYTGLLGWLFFKNQTNVEGNLEPAFQTTKITIEMISKIVFWFIFPAFMLIVSYLKIKERQV